MTQRSSPDAYRYRNGCGSANFARLNQAAKAGQLKGGAGHYEFSPHA
jgi:hypothetical protein